MSGSRDCPPVEELRSLVLGKLPDPPASDLERHLLECDRCAQQTALVDETDPLIAALKGVRQSTSNFPQDTPAPVQKLMDSLSGLFAAQGEETQLSGPHDTQDLPVDLSQNVTRELSAAWRPAESADELGRIGHYRILKLLGAGGMGAVFLAEDLQLHRHVALKMMRPKAAMAAGATERFLREARSAAALRHDHILTIYQVGEEQGVPFLAMEYLEGESLEDRLRRDPVLPLNQTLRIGREIAEGLAAAHAKGLIHRDIKPGNIWLEAGRDRVKILDFGLARLNQTDAQLTSSGMIVGTPAYMAPEQASGESVDGRADLFSLGVILYRMTTGKLPFPGKHALETLKLLATLTPPSPKSLNPAIPVALSGLIDRLLSKTPEVRPESAQSVDQELADIEREPPTDLSTARLSAVELAAQPPRPFRSWKSVAALVASSLLILLAVVIVKIKTKDGKETKVTVEVPGEVESVGTEIQNTPKPATATKPHPIDEGPRITAVLFDGVHDQVIIPSVSELTAKEFTVEAWLTPLSDQERFAPQGGRTAQQIIWIGSPGWTSLGLWPGHIDFVAMRDGTARIIGGSHPIKLGERIHVAGVYRNETVSLYFNGFPSRTSQTTGQEHWNVKGLLTIAGSTTDGQRIDEAQPWRFNGVIDQVRISEFARYTDFFTPPADFAAGDERDLICFKFDAGEGNKIRDVSGHDRHGQLIGGKWVRISKSGKIIQSNMSDLPADALTPANVRVETNTTVTTQQ